MSSVEDHVQVGSSSVPSPESSSAAKPTGPVRELRCFSTTDIPTNPQAEEDKNVCWICLDTDSPSRPLEQPCRCPRYCHLRCLARWQLQSAGTRRESQCDFCDSRLPDWRQALSLQSNINAPAIMNVSFEGKTYSFEVKPGNSGYLQFTEAIRQAFQLPIDSELNITFTCDEPCNEDGSLLTLQGPGAYDAAVYCAFVSAARRQTGHRRSHSLAGTRSVSSRDNGVSMDRPGRSTSHHRSQTSDTTSPVIRSDDLLTNPPPRHHRSRSIPVFPVTRTQRNNTAGSSSEASSGVGGRKGWTRVARRVRALYHRFLNK